MRWADERLNASIMISSSIRWSLAGKEVDCMHEDVLAADVLLNLDEDLLVGEAPDAGLAKGMLRYLATASARTRLELPAKSFIKCSSAPLAQDPGTLEPGF